jgi:hypothetical protein
MIDRFSRAVIGMIAGPITDDTRTQRDGRAGDRHMRSAA